ncbi:uncharacterized protein V1513DRAFT_164793 [Lipomyces chichibuensis]|uniref:uncharacterized protein n=1 Tax=Lipomyces chichibuensis TaxID=1546026 RepID=UPI00334413EA
MPTTSQPTKTTTTIIYHLQLPSYEISQFYRITNLMPTDSEIEAVILETLRLADFDTATLKSIRRDVVAKLDLPEDFFANADWKKKSADIADRVLDELDNDNDADASSRQRRPKGSQNKDSSKPASKKVKKTEKRTAAPEDVEGEIALNIAEEEYNATPVPVSEEPAAERAEVLEGDASEYSDVHDDFPEPTSKKRKSSRSLKIESKAPLKKTLSKKSKNNTTTKRDLDDPLEQKIATLKSWVVKCGVRKRWTRELAPYKSKNDRILHLQKMLEGLGMTPRYSLEKAKKIRERREMEAEVAQLHGEAGEPTDAGNESDNEDNDLPVSGDFSKLKSKVVAGDFSIDFLGDQSSDSD